MPDMGKPTAETLIARGLALAGYGPEARSALTDALLQFLATAKGLDARVARMEATLAEIHETTVNSRTPTAHRAK